MIKRETVEVKEVIATRLCDFCGEEANEGYRSNNCGLCNRDICPEHKITHPIDSGGDYTEYLCLECFEISKPFFEEMDKLEQEIEAIAVSMEKICKDNKETTSE